MSFKILKTMILIWDLFQRNFFFLTQVTYYLRIPDGLWLKTGQHYWKKVEDQRHFQEPTVPSDHRIPSGSLCMYFCRGWWMPCRKLQSELEFSFRSQPLKVVFRKNILASVICPWQNETWYFPRLCKSWMPSAPNGLCTDQKNQAIFLRESNQAQSEVPFKLKLHRQTYMACSSLIPRNPRQGD